MKKLKPFVGFLVLAAGLGLTVEVGAAELAARITSTSGKVLIRNESKGAAGLREAKVGAEVRSGDVLNTSGDGSAKLLFTDKTIIDLGPSSLFKVDEYELKGTANRKVALSVPYGKIRAAINAKVGDGGAFRVKTKTATMGVRGTEFVLFSDLQAPPPAPAAPGAPPAAAQTQTATKIVVLEGKVEVQAQSATNAAAAKSVILTEGKSLTTVETAGKTASSPSQVSAVKVDTLTKQEITKVSVESKVIDKTFVQAVVVDRTQDGKGSAGAQTMAALAGSIEMPQGPPPPGGGLGLPGQFGPGSGFNSFFQPPINSGAARVTVTFTP